MSIFEEDCNNQLVDEEVIKRKTKEFFSKYSGFVSLHDTLAKFFMKYGPVCSTGDIKKIIKEFEKEGLIIIQRNPSSTTNGKPTAFMSEGKGQTVSVRWAK